MKIIGRIEPILKLRIDNLQHYLDRMLNEYDMDEPMVWDVVKALFERKQLLINQI